METLAPARAPRARKLRVGVFADQPLQPRWIVEALARLAATGFVQVEVVSTGCASGSHSAGFPAWDLYRALDRRLFGPDPSDPVPLAAHLLSGAGADLDVAFAVGEVDDGALEGRARYGVWRFCFGADGAEREPLAGVREVASGEPLSASGIKVRLGRDQPARLAYQSWSRTHPYSVTRNRDDLLSKTAEFAVRALGRLHRQGEAWLARCKEMPERSAPRSRPGLREASSILLRLASRTLDKALHIEQWSLAFRFGGAEFDAGLDGFTHLVPPPDRDWADPFALEKDGRYYVFFEELPYRTGKAHISVLEIDRSGTVSAPRRVLERDYHLSYPFLLEHEGALYMLPESASNRSLELYRCTDFPHAWRLERVLIEDARLVDATLHHAGGRWWMFANSAAGASAMFNDELHVFHAERLAGEWRPNPANPVKSDARCARPAGRLFARAGILYRPAQICVPRYGAGIALHRVLRLAPDDYAERQVQRILPSEASGLLGLHTMNRAGDLTVVDTFARRRRL